MRRRIENFLTHPCGIDDERIDWRCAGSTHFACPAEVERLIEIARGHQPDSFDHKTVPALLVDHRIQP